MCRARYAVLVEIVQQIGSLKDANALTNLLQKWRPYKKKTVFCVRQEHLERRREG